MKRVIRIALIALLIFGIRQVFKNRSFNKLEAATMTIHDDAMKEMADMNRLGRSLKKLAAAADSLRFSTPRRDSLADVLRKMDTAESGMMDWMNNYSAPAKTWRISKREINYLEDQKSKIEQNQKDIRAALEAGRAFAL